MKRFWDKVNKTSGCWLWTAWRNNKGYGAFSAKHPNGGYSNKLAHRESWEMANEKKIPAGLCVLHSCDNPACVNPSHLFLGTKKDNTQDMLKKGRNRSYDAHGEDHHRSTITKEIAKTMRHLYWAERRSQHEIGRFFDVTNYLVFDVVHGRSWSRALRGEKNKAKVASNLARISA